MMKSKGYLHTALYLHLLLGDCDYNIAIVFPCLQMNTGFEVLNIWDLNPISLKLPGNTMAFSEQ